eukprot:CAMPEP_0116144056 /NCGR_PEP_ID=MMETSP0329-20121206/15782_1 /TAXON_ID=697910 /ORGANISM="Pseudo-nitzschia arenysensis, Strain B593" /LENGTH=157 /DNA_ID=CAMNT_0003639421 /DNA_START=117 /DNA_END=590 /DNA_ORIENTATION=-
MTAIPPLRCILGRTTGPLASRATAAVTVTTTASSHLPAQPLSGMQSNNKNNNQEQQRRSFWMDVVTRKPQHGKQSKKDSSNNKSNFVHEDPEQVVRRHTDETRSDGEALLDLMFYNDRHEKAWRKRQRLKDMKRYEFDKKHVNDLAKYIAFVKDHKE